MRGREGITRDLGLYLAIAQDEVQERSAYCFTCRALYPPDSDPTHTKADRMRVACESPAIATARLVCELKAEGEDANEHACDKRLAIAQ